MPNRDRLDDVHHALDGVVVRVEVSFEKLLLYHFSNHVLVGDLWGLDIWEQVLANVVKYLVVFEDQLWLRIVYEGL